VTIFARGGGILGHHPELGQMKYFAYHPKLEQKAEYFIYERVGCNAI